jgi:hypothetical protein
LNARVRALRFILRIAGSIGAASFFPSNPEEIPMSLKDEITKAIGAHGLWKSRLMAAIESGKSDVAPDQVAKDNACEFGKWIYGASVPADAKKMPEFETCRHLHADFHKTAADVLRLAISGNKAKAHEAIGHESKFANISSDLTMAMMKWSGKAH